MLQALDSDRSSSEVNIVMGMVVSSNSSLSRVRIRFGIGAQTILRARWLSDEGVTEPMRISDRVTAVSRQKLFGWRSAGFGDGLAV